MLLPVYGLRGRDKDAGMPRSFAYAVLPQAAGRGCACAFGSLRHVMDGSMHCRGLLGLNVQSGHRELTLASCRVFRERCSNVYGGAEKVPAGALGAASSDGFSVAGLRAWG